MPSRSIWTGSISFGLVSIPVKLYPAIRDRDIHFHLLHDQDKVRLQRKMVCPADGVEVHAEHTVKGYEIGPDQYVVVSQEELDGLAPKASRTIEIQKFVDLREIDPIYYQRPYYLGPGEHAAKPYRLLLQAMAQAHRVGIARFVMRNKEYLAALRLFGNVLCLATMHFGDEVAGTTEVPGLAKQAQVEDREIKVAQQPVQSLSQAFIPAKYKDEYRRPVQELIEAKARGEKVHTPPPLPKRPGRVVDLMATLEASLAQVRAERRGGSGGHSPRPTRTEHHKGDCRTPRRRENP